MNKKFNTKSYRSSKMLLDIIMDIRRSKETKEEKLRKNKYYKECWEKNNENIKVLAEKLDLVKAKIDFVKQVLSEYYINVLRKGTDIR